MAVVNAILGWKNEGDRKQDRGWAGHGPEDRPGSQPQASLFSEIFFSLSHSLHPRSSRKVSLKVILVSAVLWETVEGHRRTEQERESGVHAH